MYSMMDKNRYDFMALEYKSQLGLEAIMPVLDEYIVWYGRLVKSYFEGVPTKEAEPRVFEEWLAKAKAEKSISGATAEKAVAIHKGMVSAANSFTIKIASQEAPPLHEYNDFAGHYEEFIQFMRRLEFDHALDNSGFDEKTGLRSLKVMKSDIAREMERRARRGNPFSLALVKINNFKGQWRQDEDLCRDMVRKISSQIKECLRSFDDAYYLGQEYFLLSLKHADTLGAQAALNRLNIGITTAHIPVPGDPMDEVSVSSVLFEPTPGDTLEDLLKNMKKDLEGVDSRGTVLQYNDVSPLQRYIHSIDRTK